MKRPITAIISLVCSKQVVVHRFSGYWDQIGRFWVWKRRKLHIQPLIILVEGMLLDLLDTDKISRSAFSTREQLIFVTLQQTQHL